MVLKGVKIQEQDWDTVYRELSKRGIEYRTVGDAVTKFIDLGLGGKLRNHSEEDTPHPSGNGEGSNQKLETPVEEGKQGKEQTVTGAGPETGEKKKPGDAYFKVELIPSFHETLFCRNLQKLQAF